MTSRGGTYAFNYSSLSHEFHSMNKIIHRTTYAYHDYSEDARRLEINQHFKEAADLWMIAACLAKRTENADWARSRMELCRRLNGALFADNM